MSESNPDLPFEAAPEAPPPAPPAFNLGQVTDEVAGIVLDELNALIADAHADLQNIAMSIAPVLVSAAAVGDKDLTDELTAQLEVIGDINLIRADAAKWRVIMGVSRVALRSLSAALTGVVPAVPPRVGD